MKCLVQNFTDECTYYHSETIFIFDTENDNVFNRIKELYKLDDYSIYELLLDGEYMNNDINLSISSIDYIK